MPIAKITGHGLGSIALSVALLWGCFVGERVILNRTLAARAQVIRDLHKMQMLRSTQPAATPHVPIVPHPAFSTVG